MALISGTLSVLTASILLAEPDSGRSLLQTISQWAFVILFGVGCVYALIRLMLPPRLIVDRDGLRCEGGLRPGSLAWNDVAQIDVIAVGGSSWLYISGPNTRRDLLLQGWKLSGAEIKSRITRFREAIGQKPPSADLVMIVPEDESDQRNRVRRQGMVLVAVAALLALLSLGGVQQVGVQDLPPGIDFQWVTPPTHLGLALIVVALATSIVGIARWLWPTGKRANPPLLSTSLEWFILGAAALVLFGAAMVLVTWFLHPA